MRTNSTLVAILVALTATAIVAPVSYVYAPHKGDPYYPVGPWMDTVRIRVYPNELAEFDDLAGPGACGTNPQLDLGDWFLDTANLNRFLNCPGMHVTPPFAEFGMFDMQFNFATSPGRPTMWGQDAGLGLNPATTELRRGMVHLVDKTAFTTFFGRMARQDLFAPPAQGLPTNVESYPFDNLDHGGATILNTFDIFADTDISVPTGSPDFCAARDHFVASGLFVDSVPAGGDCILDGGSGFASALANRLIFYIRSDDVRRNTLGAAYAAAIERLFGGADVVDERFATIQQVFGIIFEGGTLGDDATRADWDWYTGGFRFGVTFDQNWGLYRSEAASDECGGEFIDFPDNYVFYCNPALDVLFDQTEFAPTLDESKTAAIASYKGMAEQVANIPVFSGANRFVYLDGWQNVVHPIGVGPGPGDFQPLYNMYRADPAVPGTIRWGFRQGTNNVNPIRGILTVWEAHFGGNIYDGILDGNPYAPSTLVGGLSKQFELCQIDPARHPTRPICPSTDAPLGYEPPVDAANARTTQVTLRFRMRGDAFFHDGTQITADDIAFSFMAQKSAVGSAISAVESVIDVTVLSRTLYDIHLDAVSPFHLLNVAGVPVVPSAIWKNPACTLPGVFPHSVVDNPSTLKCATSPGQELHDAAKTGPTYDPVSAGTMIGSNDWMCRSGAGVVGAGCTSTGAGATGVGDTIILSRFRQVGAPAQQYRNSVFNFNQFSGADRDDDADVDIQDVQAAINVFRQTGDFTVVTIAARWYDGSGTDWVFQEGELAPLYEVKGWNDLFDVSSGTGIAPFPPNGVPQVVTP